MADLIKAIKETVSLRDFFAQHVLGWDSQAKTQLCPFPHINDAGEIYFDTNPSMTIDLDKGLFHCFSCARGGDAITFFQNLNPDLTKAEAVIEMARTLGLDVPEKEIIRAEAATAPAERLWRTPKQLEFLRKIRGLTDKVIKEYGLGWDGDRITIPIHDTSGDLVNLRRYKAAAAAAKMVSYVATSGKKFGTTRLYPLSSLDPKKKEVILCEGELDALCAISNGFNAITCTGGAGTWKPQWSAVFKGKKVFICYDADGAGKAGALRVADFISQHTETHIVSLPLSDGGDVTDWFVTEKKTANAFRELLDSSPAHTPPAPEIVSSKDDGSLPTDLSLAAASEAEWHGQKIRVTAVVAGMDPAPYQVPKKVHMQCDQSMGEMCLTCRVGSAGGKMTADISLDDPVLLKFIGVNDAMLRATVKGVCGVPRGCTRVKLVTAQAVNIMELQLIPLVDFASETDAVYVVRNAFMAGETVQSNQAYILEGRTVADPRTQQVTHLFNKCAQAQSSVERFKMTDDIRHRLELRRPLTQEDEDLAKFVAREVERMEQVTGVVGRTDLLLCILLVYFSPLGFMFQEDGQRGWLDVLVLGDTRSGKTMAMQSMIEFFKAGEMAAGENCSFAGLVGGLQNSANGKRWTLMWGKFPLNDRGLFAVDEASGITTDDFGKMSSMRSRGVAEVTKIKTERTKSRVRKLWFANPRSDRGLKTYNHGVQAVKELVGRLEDVARFDFVVSVASGEVDINAIHGRKTGKRVTAADAAIGHEAVMFAWSLRPEVVTFTASATALALENAADQGRRYSAAIPLVEAAEQRIKIARVAAAFAVMALSTKDFKTITVRDSHVRMATAFLEGTYRKPSLGYDEFSRVELRKTNVNDEQGLRDLIGTDLRLVELLLETEQLTQHTLGELLGFDDRSELNRIMSMLQRANALRRIGSSYYVKTAAFISWLRETKVQLNQDLKKSQAAEAKSKGGRGSRPRY